MIQFLSDAHSIGFFEAIFEYPQIFGFSLLAGIVIGIIAPLIGSVVIIRRLSFIADTLSHFSLAGVYFGVLLSTIFDFNIPPVLVAVIFSVICTIIMEILRGFYKNYKELSMPIVMSFGTALSGIFIALSKSSSNLSGYLFGSLFTISLTDLIVITSLTVLVLIFVAIFYKKIITLCFDEVQAKISGVNTKVLQYTITIILAIFISLFIKIVGVLLISALMIIPVSASILVGKSFKKSCGLAILFSEFSIILGIYLSFLFGLPPGSLIVLLNIFVLFITMICKNISKRKQKKNKLEEE